MAWRLGIDLGTNSLGWAALDLVEDDDGHLVPRAILAAGSRIFGDGRDPKSKASLAVARRDARAMRRRRDRFLQRQSALMTYLVADGLFPGDPAERKTLETLDPFVLRARALDEALPLPHLGRALWHLNQRRGFKSNRKTDKPDDDSGKVRVGSERLRSAMADDGARTFGEWLHHRRQPSEEHPDGRSVRTRLRPEQGEDAKGTGYDFYPDRALIEEEFEAIWAAQVPHHPEVLTPQVHDRLHEIIFHQRPLKTPTVGTCTLIAGEPRLAKAHPLFQQRRLLEEVNALKIVRAGQVAERLTPEQRDLLVLKLKDKAKVSFESLRKVLKLDADARFNKESENRKELKGNEVNAATAAKTRFGGRWAHLPVEDQARIIARLEETETDEQVAAFSAWLGETYGLTHDQSEAVTKVRLPQGHGRFGMTATTGLIDMLTHGRTEDGGVLVYSEAVERLGLHHSDFRTGEVHDALPYYGAVLERHIMPGSGDPSDPEEKRVGRLTNPTVHIGLNQLRRTVNRLIERFGPPAEIAIELARDLKLTDEEKKDRDRQNRRNREDAARRSESLRLIGVDDTGENRARLKLWEELDGENAIGRACVYSGEVISIRRLFSDDVEIDHILPFSATLDDSNANKIVCVREANRFKRKRSPHEAWGRTTQWDAVAERASRLPRNKRWRFEPDAMDRFRENDGFLARQLIDTQYLSRLAREYCASLYPDRGEESSKVWVSPGRLTEMVRRKLGLNDLLPDHNFGGGAGQPKNRLDHRHHAIDAIVVGIVDRSMLQAIARASGLEGAEGRERIHIPAPWDGFRTDVQDAVRAIVVSHRADHGTAGHGTGSTAGRLHNDTAYGLTGETDAKGLPIVVRRKAFESLKPADIATIRDPDLRRELYRATEGLEGRAFDDARSAFATRGPLQFRNIRRVRVTEPLTVIPIRDTEGKAYKGYKGDSNYRYDIWEMPDGKWRAVVVSMFEAHQPGERPRPHPAARRVMQLHRDDMLAIERDGATRELVRIVKFSEKQFAVAPPQEGGALKARDADSDDPFKYIYPSPNTLKAWRARKVGVDETGRVRDPGFGARTAVRRTRPKAAE
ncbi:MAG: type II CRISPR RNA-guided endonuclease Cas9 [Sphingomonas taxi]